jgi:phosphoenolpyruvate-protein kinase (PTS system EI component)
MLPMITHYSQVMEVRKLLEKISTDLDGAGVERGDIPPLGIMVETPAAVLSLDHLLPHSDFVSIGSNDLTQYTLAVDRGSPYVSKLFDSFHPAVIRQIEMVARKCRETEKWSGICGQMASDPLAIPLLLGFGLNEFSVPITLIPDVKEMIRVIDFREAEELAMSTLTMGSGEEIRMRVLDYVQSRYPDIILDEILRDREDGES